MPPDLGQAFVPASVAVCATVWFAILGIGLAAADPSGWEGPRARTSAGTCAAACAVTLVLGLASGLQPPEVTPNLETHYGVVVDATGSYAYDGSVFQRVEVATLSDGTYALLGDDGVELTPTGSNPNLTGVTVEGAKEGRCLPDLRDLLATYQLGAVVDPRDGDAPPSARTTNGGTVMALGARVDDHCVEVLVDTSTGQPLRLPSTVR